MYRSFCVFSFGGWDTCISPAIDFCYIMELNMSICYFSANLLYYKCRMECAAGVCSQLYLFRGAEMKHTKWYVMVAAALLMMGLRTAAEQPAASRRTGSGA